MNTTENGYELLKNHNKKLWEFLNKNIDTIKDDNNLSDDQAKHIVYCSLMACAKSVEKNVYGISDEK